MTLAGQLSLSDNASAYTFENGAKISIKTTSGSNDREPINLAKKEDYPDIKFWTHQDFKQWERTDGLRTAADRGSLPFLEKCDGNVFSPNELRDIMKTFRSVWFGLTHQDKAPASWGKAIPAAKNWLYTEVSRAHPELALSEGYWKIEAVATERYSSWASTHKKPEQTTPHASDVDVKPLGHAESKPGGQRKRKMDSRTPDSASSDVSITTPDNSITKDLDCADQPKRARVDNKDAEPSTETSTINVIQVATPDSTIARRVNSLLFWPLLIFMHQKPQCHHSRTMFHSSFERSIVSLVTTVLPALIRLP